MDDYMEYAPTAPQNTIVTKGQNQQQQHPEGLPSIGQVLHLPTDNRNPASHQYSENHNYHNQRTYNYPQQNYQSYNYAGQNFQQPNNSEQSYASGQSYQQQNYQDHNYPQAVYPNYTYSQQTISDQYFFEECSDQGNSATNYSQTNHNVQLQPQHAPTSNIIHHNFPGQGQNYSHSNFPTSGQFQSNYSLGHQPQINYSRHHNPSNYSDQHEHQPNLSEYNLPTQNPFQSSVLNQFSSVRSGPVPYSQPNFAQENVGLDQHQIQTTPSKQSNNSSQRQPLQTQSLRNHAAQSNFARQGNNPQNNTSGALYALLTNSGHICDRTIERGQEQQKTSSCEQRPQPQKIQGDQNFARQSLIPSSSTGKPRLQSTLSNQVRSQLSQRRQHQQASNSLSHHTLAQNAPEYQNFARQNPIPERSTSQLNLEPILSTQNRPRLTQQTQDLAINTDQQRLAPNKGHEYDNLERRNQFPLTTKELSQPQPTLPKQNFPRTNEQRLDSSDPPFSAQENQTLAREQLPLQASSGLIAVEQTPSNKDIPHVHQTQGQSQASISNEIHPAQNALQEVVDLSQENPSSHIRSGQLQQPTSSNQEQTTQSERNEPQPNTSGRSLRDVLEEDEPVMFNPQTMPGLAKDHFNERITDLMNWTKDDMTKHFNEVVPAQNRALKAKDQAEIVEARRKLQEFYSETPAQAPKPPPQPKYIKMRDTRPKMNMRELPKKDPYGNDFVTCSEYSGLARFYLVKFSSEEEEKPEVAVEHRIRTREEMERDLMEARAKAKPLEQRYPRLSKLVIKPSIFETTTTSTKETVKEKQTKRKIPSENKSAKRRKGDEESRNATEREACENDEEIARILHLEETNSTLKSTNVGTIEDSPEEDPNMPCCSKSFK